MKKTLNINLSKGYALGVAYEKSILQFAIIKLLIEVDFSVIRKNISRLILCFKEN